MIINADKHIVSNFTIDDNKAFTLLSNTATSLTYMVMPYNTEDSNECTAYFEDGTEFMVAMELTTGVVIENYTYYLKENSFGVTFFIVCLTITTIYEKLKKLEYDDDKATLIIEDLFQYEINNDPYPCHVKIKEMQKDNIRFNNIYYTEFTISGFSEEAIKICNLGFFYTIITNELLAKIEETLHLDNTWVISYHFDMVPEYCMGGIHLVGCIKLNHIDEMEVLTFTEDKLVLTNYDNNGSTLYLLAKNFLNTEKIRYTLHQDSIYTENNITTINLETTAMCLTSAPPQFMVSPTTDTVYYNNYYYDSSKQFIIFKTHSVTRYRYIALSDSSKEAELKCNAYIHKNRILRKLDKCHSILHTTLLEY